MDKEEIQGTIEDKVLSLEKQIAGLREQLSNATLPGQAGGSFFTRVPTAMVAWAFIASVAIAGVVTFYSIRAWTENRTFTVAGYEFGQSAIGGGAVIAYDFEHPDQDKTCPDGWTLFTPAIGRVIIGAGEPSNGQFNTWRDNPKSKPQPISTYTFRVPGGAETHTLTIEEMPEHRHSFQKDFALHLHHPEQRNGDQYNNPHRNVDLLTRTDLDFQSIQGVFGTYIVHGDQDSLSQEFVGGNSDGLTMPHNNMPPYIALYFCKKEG